MWNHNDSCSSDLPLQTTDTGNGSRGAYMACRCGCPSFTRRWSGTAGWATEVRMPDSLSDAKMVNKAALDCPDAPLGRHKVGETFPKSAGCTLEEQKRPKVLPKGFGASLKCIESKKNISQLKEWTKLPDSAFCVFCQFCHIIFPQNPGLPFRKCDINGKSTKQWE